MLFNEPSFLVQVGHQGDSLATDAVKNGYADGAILSPVDYKITKNRRLSRTIREHGGIVLFDPQMYNPRFDDYEMNSYNYFFEYGGEDFETTILEDEDIRQEFCEMAIIVQNSLEVDGYIAPSRYLSSISEAGMRFWQDVTETFLDVARDEDNDKPVYASLPVNGESLEDSDNFTELLNWATSVDVDGFYVSAEFDQYHQYPLTDTTNLIPFLKLLRTLRENRYELIVGHTHHVAHLLFGVGVKAFASGHNKNLRSFDTERWEDRDDGAGVTVVDYYSDKLLNDLRVYRPGFEDDSGTYSDFDLLEDNGFDLDSIRTGSPFEEVLFSGPGPASESEWPQKDGSWNHYLWSCHQIAEQYRSDTLQDEMVETGDITSARLKRAQNRVEEAKELYEEIDEEGILLHAPEESIYADWEDALEEISP